MPRLSPGGYGVVGGIDAEVWVQTSEGTAPYVPLPLVGIRAGGWDWLTSTPLMIAGPGEFSTVWTVRGVDLTMGVTVELDATPNAANWFGAGAGRFASAGTQPLEVRAGALPVPSPLHYYYGAGFYTMSRDGLLVLKPDYQAQSGVRVLDSSQTIYDDPTDEFVACNDGLLIVIDGGQMVCHDFQNGSTRVVPLTESIGQVWRVCRWRDTPYCLTWQAPFSRLVLHSFTSAFGWIVSGDSHDFNPDGAADDTRCRVVSSAGQGERPHELRSYVFHAEQPRTDLRLGPVQPLPPVTDVPLLGRPFACLMYAEHDAPVPAPAITIPVRGTTVPTGWDCPTIDALMPPADRLWAMMAGESDGVTCEQRIKDARPVANLLARSLVVYQDDAGPLRPSVTALLEHGDVPSFRCYRQPGQSLAVYKSATADAFRQSPYIAPTIRISNGPLTTAETIEAFVAGTQLAAEQDWQGACIFGWGRGDTPSEVLPYVDRFLSGITATPPPRVKPIPPVSPFPFAKEFHMSSPIKAAVVGPGGYFGRVSPQEPGRIYFDRTSAGADEEVELSQPGPDTLWAIRFKTANVIVNFAPKWECGTDLNRQFETRPANARGHDESPAIVNMPDGPIVAYVPFDWANQPPFTSAPLTVVLL